MKGNEVTLPDNVVWRKGLARASGPERLVILEAERSAKEIAFADAYNARCKEVGSILCDAHDLAIRGASTKWCRFKGRLFLIITVYHRSAGRVRVFGWRSAVRGNAHGGVNK